MNFFDLKSTIDNFLWEDVDDYLSGYVRSLEEDEMEGWVRDEHLKKNFKLVILKLAEKSICAYQIRKKLDNQVSFGTLHPLLESLDEKNGYLHSQSGEERNKKIYSITDLGREFLRLNRVEREKLWKIILTTGEVLLF